MVGKIFCIIGDITEQRVDSIVNAANKTLLGGGGVDGFIHTVAGRELYDECLLLGGCEHGEAKITKGYNLPAKYVIHTVGPIYGNHGGKEADILASCYRNALNLAVEMKLKSIAFPAISTGAYGYPKEEAASVAVGTVMSFLKETASDIEVTFVLYTPEDASYYRQLLDTSAKVYEVQ